MSNPPYVPVHVSEAHRERAVQLLSAAFADDKITVEQLEPRLAAVYRAQSLAELDQLMVDPSDPSRSLAMGQALTVQESLVTPRGVLAGIMGGFGHKGGWTVPRHLKVWAVMGGGDLDLRDARFGAGVTTIEVVAFWGGVDIIVPEGVRVEVVGMAIAGAFEQQGGDNVDDPNAPVLRITGAAIMGAVEISRLRREKKSERRYVEALERAEALRRQR